MTCYNAATTIEESIRSVLAQTFTEWELVLVDNCSTDDSLAIVERLHDTRIRVFALETNHGRTAALNVGVENVRGDFVAVLDADDISSPDRLQVQVDYLTKFDKVVAVGSWYRNIDRDRNLLDEVKTPTRHAAIVRRLAIDNPLVHSSVMFRTKPIRVVGGYSSHYQYSQDFALWIALATTGELAILPRFLTDIRRTTRSLSEISGNSLILAHDCYELYRKAQSLPGLTLLDKIKGRRTIGLYGLLYSWRLATSGKPLHGLLLLIRNLWAIPLAIFELLRKAINPVKSI